jgi:hypothetical protein
MAHSCKKRVFAIASLIQMHFTIDPIVKLFDQQKDPRSGLNPLQIDDSPDF